jgi:hydroxyacylglutathione hydrolase
VTASELTDAAAAGAVVVDTRKWGEFARGHVAGSLHAPMNKAFPTVVGSYIEPEQRVFLVVEPEQVHDAVLGLIRVGLDRIAGFVTPGELELWLAEGNGEAIATVSVDDFAVRQRAGGIHVLDVRGLAEFEAGHVAGAQNIAHTRLAPELNAIPRDLPLYVHCQSGIRAAYGAAFLAREGFDVVYVGPGGYPDIAKAGVETEVGAEVDG